MTRRKPKVVRLPAPKDTEFIRTLVWILDKARKGEINGYAMVYDVSIDGSHKTVECADAFTESDRLHILGAIRMMELNFIKREWPEK